MTFRSPTVQSHSKVLTITVKLCARKYRLCLKDIFYTHLVTLIANDCIIQAWRKYLGTVFYFPPLQLCVVIRHSPKSLLMLVHQLQDF